MTKKKIVVGNWKMNPLSLKEAEKLLNNISKSVSSIRKTDIVVCAPSIYIEKLKKITKKISLGSQDLFWGEIGPFTGQVSGEMLYNLGVRYAILGHSERRNLGEDNLTINKKVKASLSSGIVPILCIGEDKRDENHEYLILVKKQLEEGLLGVSKNSISKVIIAYEPVWAIGKGANPATPAEFLEMSIFIKKILSDKFGVKEISNVKIIYGGSVDDKNTNSFIEEGRVDGFLPGRTSLNPEKFSKIIQICEASNK